MKHNIENIDCTYYFKAISNRNNFFKKKNLVDSQSHDRKPVDQDKKLIKKRETHNGSWSVAF